MGELSLPMRLLDLLSYGGIRSTSELARRLGVSEALVGMMAEDLARRGYLQAVAGGDCDAESTVTCGGCSIVSQCKLPGAEDRLPLLALTEKGKSAAHRPGARV
jgi:hypothetical protein